MVVLDVSQASEVKKKAASILKEIGGVDVLINSAGITHTATFLETPTEKYEVISDSCIPQRMPSPPPPFFVGCL